MPNLRKLKKTSWEFYKKWRTEKTFCPAFNSEIQVSLKGWNHIIGQSTFRKRNPKDVYRRLLLLPQAKKIIEKSHTVQTITRKYGKVFYGLEAMTSSPTDTIGSLRKIIIVFIKTHDDKYIFYSVMDRKINEDGSNKRKKRNGK